MTLVIILLSLCQCLGTSSAASLTASFCNSDRSVCVNAVADTTARTVTYNVASTSTGWAAIGVGTSRMVGNGLLYVGWSNSTGGVTLSQRTASSRSQPLVNSTAGPFTQLAYTGSILTSRLRYSFQRPLDSLVSLTAPSDHIWAYRNSTPTDIDSPSSTFSRHDARGSFTLTFTEAAEPTAGNTGNNNTNVNTNPSIAASNFCASSDLFCVNAEANKETGLVTFSISSSSRGWVGMGVGSSTMVGATIFVAWLGSSDQLVLSQRSAPGTVQPTVVSSPIFKLLTSAKTTSARIQFTFTIPLSSPQISSTGATSFIWAASNAPPTDLNSNTSSFGEHDVRGAFSMDLSRFGSGASTSTTTSGYSASDIQKLRTAHGVCMFLAWGIFPYAGIYIARYLKDAWGHAWFKAHMSIFMFGVGGLTLAGLVCIEVGVPSGAQRFVSTTHGILGTTLALGLWPAQVILGVVADKLWKADREGIPWWDQMHWWLGRAMVVFAGVTFYFGLAAFGADGKWYAIVYVLVGMGWVALIVGQVRGGAVHHVGGKKEYAGVSESEPKDSAA
ncbi:hypothetical protein HDV05_007706 [Chytridiales sp. JEL 0842]|nr:hypothetical protein HDV05_007706 [Chytridiales sp. JEL 0842]